MLKKITIATLMLFMLTGCIQEDLSNRKITPKILKTATIADVSSNFTFMYPKNLVSSKTENRIELSESQQISNNKLVIEEVTSSDEQFSLITAIERTEEASSTQIKNMYPDASDISVGYVTFNKIDSIVTKFRVDKKNGYFLEVVMITTNTKGKMMRITSIDTVNEKGNVIGTKHRFKDYAYLIASSIKLK